MTPLDCQKTWIPQNIQKGEIPGEGYSYSLYPPMKISETFYKDKFYIYTSDGKTMLKHNDDWSTLELY
jgi:hypothetical protein